eukprot:m.122296 g.122296  ORF g.122296 m.122296 type:complete len:125 (-) comp12938_c0_seq1:326-700(-)
MWVNQLCQTHEESQKVLCEGSKELNSTKLTAVSTTSWTLCFCLKPFTHMVSMTSMPASTPDHKTTAGQATYGTMVWLVAVGAVSMFVVWFVAFATQCVVMDVRKHKRCDLHDSTCINNLRPLSP